MFILGMPAYLRIAFVLFLINFADTKEFPTRCVLRLQPAELITLFSNNLPKNLLSKFKFCVSLSLLAAANLPEGFQVKNQIPHFVRQRVVKDDSASKTMESIEPDANVINVSKAANRGILC